MNDAPSYPASSADFPKDVDPCEVHDVPEFRRHLNKLGLVTCRVTLEHRDVALQGFLEPDFPEKLGEELDRAHLGSFDAQRTIEERMEIFFVLKKGCEEGAIEIIKQRLERVLVRVQIHIAEAESENWRIVFPQ